ncbi:MAG TPA: hypothetical protein VKW06_07835 [Candidatus Angelobacter sp.]|nr:hypothetical protein [Candidatus Angelobacter sp.]
MKLKDWTPLLIVGAVLVMVVIFGNQIIAAFASGAGSKVADSLKTAANDLTSAFMNKAKDAFTAVRVADTGTPGPTNIPFFGNPISSGGEPGGGGGGGGY